LQEQCLRNNTEWR